MPVTVRQAGRAVEFAAVLHLNWVATSIVRQAGRAVELGAALHLSWVATSMERHGREVEFTAAAPQVRTETSRLVGAKFAVVT